MIRSASLVTAVVALILLAGCSATPAASDDEAPLPDPTIDPAPPVDSDLAGCLAGTWTEDLENLGLEFATGPLATMQPQVFFAGTNTLTFEGLSASYAVDYVVTLTPTVGNDAGLVGTHTAIGTSTMDFEVVSDTIILISDAASDVTTESTLSGNGITQELPPGSWVPPSFSGLADVSCEANRLTLLPDISSIQHVFTR